jgi:hypothetical protein
MARNSAPAPPPVTTSPVLTPRRTRSSSPLEDGPRQALERLLRFQPELVHEHSPTSLVDLQRLGLPAGAVQRQHQLPAQTFSERVVGNEFLELAGQVGVKPGREVALDAFFQAGEPLFLQAGDLCLGELLVGEVAER